MAAQDAQNEQLRKAVEQALAASFVARRAKADVAKDLLNKDRAPTADDIDRDLPALFGIDLPGPDSKEVFLSRNQVFETAAFAPLAAALQAAQAGGYGTLATGELATVRNEPMGVPGGHALNLTVVRLDEPSVWRAALPADVRAALDARGDGPFENFPFYNTFTQLELTTAQANLLANMMTWVLTHPNNRAVFDRAFAPASA